MNMHNITISVERNNYIVVRADTPRFGEQGVMFEGNTFDECFAYIKRETGMEKLSLSGYVLDGEYTDRCGRCFPSFMRVNS